MYCSGTRVAILGTMLELGEIAEESHFEVGRHAAECAQELIFIGEFAEVMREGPAAAQCFPPWTNSWRIYPTSKMVIWSW